MKKSQIFKLILSVFAVCLVLAGVIISFFFNMLPERLRILPLPLIVAAIAILLILKSTGKSMDAPPLNPPDETDPDAQDVPPEQESPTEAAPETAPPAPGEDAPSPKNE